MLAGVRRVTLVTRIVYRAVRYRWPLRGPLRFNVRERARQEIREPVLWRMGIILEALREGSRA